MVKNVQLILVAEYNFCDSKCFYLFEVMIYIPFNVGKFPELNSN